MGVSERVGESSGGSVGHTHRKLIMTKGRNERKLSGCGVPGFLLLKYEKKQRRELEEVARRH